MIAIVRIRGQVGLNKKVKETLERLRVRRKYTCVVLEKPNESQLGMVESVRDFVAFGEINEETYKKLKEARDQGKKFFRLHPPRKGIKSKLHFPKGVLGDNKDKINDLILRML